MNSENMKGRSGGSKVFAGEGGGGWCCVREGSFLSLFSILGHSFNL